MRVSKRKKYAPYLPDQQAKKENYIFLNTLAEKHQIVLAGDSITEFYQVGEFFREYTQKSGRAVYNRGISGDISLYLKERFAQNVLAIHPRQIIFLIGTNDIDRGFSAHEICANVEDMLQQARGFDSEIALLLLAVYPINPQAGNVHKRSNELIQACNTQLAALAGRVGVPFLDLTKPLSDEKGNLCADYTYDGLHLNARGYAVVTGALLPLLL